MTESSGLDADPACKPADANACRMVSVTPCIKPVLVCNPAAVSAFSIVSVIALA
ncbi:MAG: hypothetical protein ACR2GP_13985 [Burkholderiaceae bacterium]